MLKHNDEIPDLATMNVGPPPVGKPDQPDRYPKYHKDSPFTDPVVRCDSCARMILLTELKAHGVCSCGNRKVRNLMAFSFREWLKLKFWWRVDPKFLEEFGHNAQAKGARPNV